VRGWVANRFYYQIAIPIKDAAVLSNCPDRDVRRGWVQRILDHDGFSQSQVEIVARVDDVRRRLHRRLGVHPRLRHRPAQRIEHADHHLAALRNRPRQPAARCRHRAKPQHLHRVTSTHHTPPPPDGGTRLALDWAGDHCRPLREQGSE